LRVFNLDDGRPSAYTAVMIDFVPAKLDTAESPKASWREIVSDATYVTFNEIFRDGIESAHTFQYRTDSGFAFETFNKVLPVFNAEEQSVGWYNFEPSSPWDLYSLPKQELQSPYLGETGEGEWIGHSAIAFLADPEPVAIADFFIDSRFDVRAAVEGWIRSARQCFERLEKRLVDHNPVRLLLMAGRKYLVSRTQRERTEAAADDHTTHLELLTLSRDHSGQTSFSAVFRGLREFGWRLWSQLIYRNSSSIFCTPWSRTRSSYCCP
jgi:hypothetical protein